MPTIAPYGSWRSPISSELIVRSSIKLSQPMIEGQTIYWMERRPLEGGRSVVVRRDPDGATQDVTPAGFNVRTLVHEYGGGDYMVADGVVFFVNYADQRIYQQRPGEAPEPLTPAGRLRFADFVLDAGRGRLVAVCEDHSAPGEAQGYLAAISLSDGRVTQLRRGRTFYAAPRVAPGGGQIAWLEWDHPGMPWDSAELWVAPIDGEGGIGLGEQIAGGRGDSAFQPSWGPEGALYFVAERTGWWNLYRWHGGETAALLPLDAEFGLPQWVFGLTTYAVLAPGRLLVTYCERGTWHLRVLEDQSLEALALPYTEYSYLQADRATGLAVFVGSSPTSSACVTLLDIADGVYTEIQRSSSVAIDPGYLAIPETVEFPTEGGLTAFGFFYAPANADYAAPAGELPPLLVMSHGGPTGATSTSLDLEIQYWTSRGFGVLDVNYGGSTGYGRAYRERLDGRWGIVDVDDCCNGALFLARQGRADRERLAITGGSAGGYTTLAALTFRDVFKSGASHYGIGDLEALATDTHKFESRYLDGLIAPYPERRDIYHERSPIHHVSGLECPVAFFQGLEDKVVPPNQAEAMVAALRTKGIPVAYVPFEGEQHGFRKAENIRRALDGEFYFYSRVFGYTPAEAIEPVAIENMG